MFLFLKLGGTVPYRASARISVSAESCHVQYISANIVSFSSSVPVMIKSVFPGGSTHRRNRLFN